jgi:hypothetical protein
MTRRFPASMNALAGAIVVMSLAWIPVAGQTSPPAAKAKPAAKAPSAAKTYAPPKTSWGDPDLQGIWPGDLHAPLQRPENLKDKTVLTEEEFAARQTQPRRRASQPEAGPERVGIGPPSYWNEPGRQSRQTSLIVDPPDGRLPPFTPEGKVISAAAPAEWRGVANSWNDLSLYYRCVTRGLIGTMMPSGYDNGNQILQTPGYVVIRQEMIHETRVIPIDGRPHPGKDIHMLMGDSRGHWEGNTLVVETTNFTDKTSIGGNGAAYNGEGGRNSEALRIVERFTRSSENTLSYQATIDDPKTWTRPWTISIPFELNNEYGFYEYACHEGNYAMGDILSGARADEKAADEAKKVSK